MNVKNLNKAPLSVVRSMKDKQAAKLSYSSIGEDPRAIGTALSMPKAYQVQEPSQAHLCTGTFG